MPLRRRHLYLPCAAAIVAPSPALAHSPLAGDTDSQLAAGVSALVLATLWLLYLSGAFRQPPRKVRLAGFHAAMLLSLLAVLGPLDTLAQDSTAWHMVQHMLFLVVIAPLWVLSRPLPQLAAAGGRLIARMAGPLLRCARHPMLIAYIHAFVIWFWHTPHFYRLALDDPWWHLTEHTLFLVTAGLLWWVVLHSSRRHMGWALAALLFTLMNTGFLGAVLTFASSPLYGDARGLEDQQLAGLIMWVPGAVPYLLASAWVGYRWTKQMQRTVVAQARHSEA
ncbi:cytochrome c oxidase assembly protein [Allohahella marinimesophila]|uniref:Cytochrome c oxidase assembly factor CtaG n=1 Tax=Allohahella marinimesophila TaxID=1054972 RepID=A0ABP7PGG0_9GAMM